MEECYEDQLRELSEVCETLSNMTNLRLDVLDIYLRVNDSNVKFLDSGLGAWSVHEPRRNIHVKERFDVSVYVHTTEDEHWLNDGWVVQAQSTWTI